MADIFISYASEDRARAEQLAQALGGHAWSIWWDREIPLGRSFDEVIEKALTDARCVVVLWSTVSVASEWVRNEASEGRRRGILIPVFIEVVEAPLAFRLLNGADLREWHGDTIHPEFLRLCDRIGELLEQSGAVEMPEKDPAPIKRTHTPSRKTHQTVMITVFAALAVVAAGLGGYIFRGGSSERNSDAPISVPRESEESSPSDIEKRIRDLVGPLAGGIPATSLAKGFYVPGLGVRMTFLTSEQSATMLGTMPAGALVMEVESGRPMARSGIHAGDVILSIGGKKIVNEDDLRQAIFKIGPGKTDYSYRRGADINTVTVDCPSCKVE
jgi:hypothetical protein